MSMFTGTEAVGQMDAFRRWWWPGQWLSIVYGVWVNQLWYWQHIRPRLDKHGWLILPQAFLGGILAAVVLQVFFEIVLSLAGRPVDWGAGFKTIGYQVVSAVPVAALLSSLDSLGLQPGTAPADSWKRRVTRFIPHLVCLISISGFSPLLFELSGWETGWVSPWQGLLFVVILLSIFGSAIGVGLTVALSAVPKWIYPLIGAMGILVGVLMALNPLTPPVKSNFPLSGLPLNLFICVALALFLFLAERWAIRQVPDAAARKSMVTLSN